MIGPLLWADDACEAVQATLETWLPSVLTELEAVGKPHQEAPAGYQQLPNDSASTAEAYPAIIIASPGLASAPVINGDGTVDLTWSVIVSAILRGTDYDTTQKNIRVYMQALTLAIAQHATLGGHAQSAAFTDASFRNARDSAARTLAFGHIELQVTVPASFDISAGPDTPPDPGETSPDDPTVIDTPIDLTRES